MSNTKLSITAEFIAIMKSTEDIRYNYFISSKAKKYYNFAKFIFKEKRIEKVFNERLNLSKRFDEKIKTSKAKQIIELACGYSLRGFELCSNNPHLLYIDVDFPEVIKYKKNILENICKDKMEKFPKNYHLISADVLTNELLPKLLNILSNKPTLIVAEGLTSYFNQSEYELFITNIKEILKTYPKIEFFSHEQISKQKSISYKLMRSLITLITHNRSHQKFNSPSELEKYLKSQNISKYEIKLENNQIFYSIWK